MKKKNIEIYPLCILNLKIWRKKTWKIALLLNVNLIKGKLRKGITQENLKNDIIIKGISERAF